MSNRSTLKLITLTVLPLAACASMTMAPPGEGSAATCRQAPLAQFVGQQATQRLGAEMLAASHARVIRWVTIGMMLTMEFRADRVTVRIDKANRVLAASCG